MPNTLTSTIKLKGSMREFRSTFSTFESEYYKQKQIWESEIRNWEIQPDASIPWIFYIKDNDGIIYQTTFVDCNCDDYANLKIGTCMHMAALLWRARFMFGGNANKIKNTIFYDSEKNCLIWKDKTKLMKISTRNELSEIISRNTTIALTEGAKKRIAKWDEFLKTQKEILNKKQQLVNSNDISEIFKAEKIQLYQYQVDSAIHMLLHPRSILALPMGYGKTITTLACIKHIEKTENRSLKILIVCPSSLKMQWAKEANKYLKSKKTIICTGNKEAPVDKAEFIIVNYESLYRVPKLLDQDFDLLVLDEVQKVRNKDTKSWRSVKQVKNKMCYALSGTVVENSVEDFIAIMEIIDEKMITPKWRFVNEFCDHTKLKIYGIKPDKVEDLRKKFSDYIIKCNVPKTLIPTNAISEIKQDISISIDPDQKSKSDEFFAEAKKLLAKSQNKPLSFHEKIILNAMLTNSRMAANDIRLIDKTSKIVSTKTIEIANYIEKHTKLNQKVVVYSQWIEYLKLVEQELAQKSIKCICYNGSMNMNRKNNQLISFQNDPTLMVFLSTDAGGVGLDGLQLVSNVIVHCESVWNPAKIAQRNGRLIRIGQKQKTVNIYNFYSKDTIEDQFIRVNNARKETIRSNIISE